MLCALLARKQARAPPVAPVALVAGIKEHKTVNLSDLIFAEVEAENVAKQLKVNGCFKDVEVMLGGDPDYMRQPTKDEAFLRHLDRSHLVHLATHGFINSRYEEGGILLAAHLMDPRSAVPVDQAPRQRPTGERTASAVRSAARAFSADESVRTGVILSAEEISKRKLRARLVVLSACDTATGVIAGEGVVGLGRALLAAGAPCSLLSQWHVVDETTGDLMELFYGGLVAGAPVARAIRTAMLTMMEMRDDWGPKHGLNRWAAFMPYGFPSITFSAGEGLQTGEPPGFEVERVDTLPVTRPAGALVGVRVLVMASICVLAVLGQRLLRKEH
jgi:CHAT domain-containing protein